MNILEQFWQLLYEQRNTMSAFQTNGLSLLNIDHQLLEKQDAINNIPTWSINLLPTAKDVLRQTIHKNRKRKGQELPVIEKCSTLRRRPKQRRNGVVSEEILRRREKNRKAAKKCRENKRKVIYTLEEKVEKYENRNKKLEEEIQSFEKEINELKSLLHGHSCRKKNPEVTHHHCSEQQLQMNDFDHISETASQDERKMMSHQEPEEQSNSLQTLLGNEGSSIEEFLNELQNDELWQFEH